MKLKNSLGLIIIAAGIVAWMSPTRGRADPGTLADNTLHPQLQQMKRDISMFSSQAIEGRQCWVELGARSDLSISGLGGQLGVGCLMRFFGVDARLSSGRATYEAFEVSPGASQVGWANEASYNSESEANRPRGSRDSWRYMIVEPGLSISGRIFPRSLPQLSERARVALGYGSFHDSANNLDFSAHLFSAETTAFWQLGEHSRWSFYVALAWQWGALYSKAPEMDASMRRLPLSWVTSSVGLTYSF